MDYIDPELININRERRQRRELSNIDELAASIKRVGLINPITIDADLNLIAGERRLTACLQLQLPQVAVVYKENLSQDDLYLIELEENVKRVDLTWRERVDAVVAYHNLRLASDPEWTKAQTAEEIGVSVSIISKYFTVYEHIDNDMVASADKFSVALNVAQRQRERKAATESRDISKTLDEALGFSTPATASDAQLFSAPEPEPTHAEIINADFTKWLNSPTFRPFNFLHCDFPYGVRTGSTKGQSAAKSFGTYEDSTETYFQLLNALSKAMPFIMAPSAHLIFWFSMDYYTETKAALEGMGWKVLARPLVWHKSDNTGILPDPNRGPRYTYETAFFASLGDRKIVRAVANSYSGAVTRERHTSEKPQAMLEHFFRMIVDVNTFMLDPTTGSGNSVIVSERLGATYSLGLELNPEYATSAKDALLRVVSPKKE